MADVKWIKIATDMFDNRKIKQIEILPDGDAIIVIWVKILCLAGVINEDGCLLFTKEIPYTEELMATQFNRPINTIRLALKTFEEFGMIEVIDSVIRISNWEKYQNIEGMERVREQTKKRVASYRARQKQALIEQCNVTETLCNATEEDIEEDIERDKEKDNIYLPKEKVKKERVSCQQIADLYNDTCVSFPHLTTLSDARRKAINARLNTYSVDDFKRLFELAENSKFLKGGNDRNWRATFDWLIKDSNMAKVLDGNYNDRDNKKDEWEEWLSEHERI